MRKLAVLDIETDPFLYGRIPLPFACGFFDGSHYHQTWGDDCITQILQFLQQYPDELSIYAHNGGKFDWVYFSHALDGPLKFINDRLVQASLLHHIVRDSYAILPAPLRDYKKDTTDYSTFEYGVREQHKKSIGEYLRSDCLYLYELVDAFLKTYKFNITIGSCALKQLKQFHPVMKRGKKFDEQLRPYYFGGRVQCFEKGWIKAPLKLYDINSSYPNVMRNYPHPAGQCYETDKLPKHGVYFATIIADSDGALPVRTKTGLQFPHVKCQEFRACSHEIESGLRADKLKIRAVKECHAFTEVQSFDMFVDHFFNLKVLAEKNKDAAMRLVYKLLLNNAYGKFAQNPENFFDYALDIGELDGWIPCGELGPRTIYKRPAGEKDPRTGNIVTKDSGYIDVAIGASITSAARAYLFDALQMAERPLYCDTDSIICTHLDAPLHASNLGAWKLEAEGDAVAICGKKLYALMQGKKCIKAASKGLPCDPAAIVKLARTGLPQTFQLAAPTLRVGSQPKFMTRKARIT